MVVTKGDSTKQIIVTGISRQDSIGPSVVRQLLSDGHRVIVHGFSPFDSLVDGYRDASQTFTELFVKSLQEQGYDVDMVSSSDLSHSVMLNDLFMKQIQNLEKFKVSFKVMLTPNLSHLRILRLKKCGCILM